MITSLLPDITDALRRATSSEIRTDTATRLLYSTDASIYQIEPLGVAFPRQMEDLAAIMEICASYDVPVLPRGAGSSLAGQAIGSALIVDCSRHLNRLLEIDSENKTAIVEPGLVLAALNRAAAQYNLQFGPDPASAERATLGGCLANNATGAHSIRYGMAADHLLSTEVIFSDGSLATLEAISLTAAQKKADHLFISRVDNDLYRTALDIRQNYAATIQANWPRTWRRASGYNLNYLLPWSPTQPPEWYGSSYPPCSEDTINLAPLVAGSEGTLAIIGRAKLRLVPLPAHTILAVLAFTSIADACDAVSEILNHHPSAVELIPRSLVQLARSVPAYAQQLQFLNGLRISDEMPDLLVVEFSNTDPKIDLAVVAQKMKTIAPMMLAETAAHQRSVWNVRKVGLGIFMSQPGDVKPWSFIEDLAVPVENLGEFVREMDRILAEYHTYGEIYAHASAGCLHIRPLVNLKTVDGIAALREIAMHAVDLTIRLGGSVSGEHGDGLARSEWLERMFGADIISLFRQIKQAADPNNLLNPGKIVSLSDDIPLPHMDDNLRFGSGYSTHAWQANLDFTRQGSLAGAIEQCNGAGVCRKSEGVMCPSFQASQEEMHSTRGRANLLRAIISGKLNANHLGEQIVYESMDLCLACKGCKAECPSAVDMAKLKYEFLNYYYQQHTRRMRDYLFAYIGPLARLGYPFAAVINPFLQNDQIARLGEKLLGISSRRKMPRLASSWETKRRKPKPVGDTKEVVIFLPDAFNTFFDPDISQAALDVLHRAGCQVKCLPIYGAGRTLLSKGFLDAARKHAQNLVDKIWQMDPTGTFPVVGIEPSEIYTLQDEYLDLLPHDERIGNIAARAFSIEEFLVRPRNGKITPSDPSTSRFKLLQLADELRGKQIYVHTHCYQKAQAPATDGYPNGAEAVLALLKGVGFEVNLIQAGCCGMAGAFGYEKEHYALSMQIAELSLLPAIRKTVPDAIIAASGTSCRAQIEDATGRKVVHPVLLL